MLLFLKFIKQEEEYYLKLTTETIIEIQKKNKKPKIQKSIIINNDTNNEINRVNNKFIWLKNNCISCRYDCFFLIYTLIIKNIIKKNKIISEITEI